MNGLVNTTNGGDGEGPHEPRIMYRGKPVMTTEQLAKAYGVTVDNIHDGHRQNPARFREGHHLFKLTGSELKTFKNYPVYNRLVAPKAPHLILWTDRGAARHAKLLESDEAWDAFERLEDTYFAVMTGAIALPNFSDPVAAARAWADEHEARQIAERTKAEIGARREATAMNTASQAVKKIKRLEIELDQSAGWASVKRMEKVYRGRKFDWRALKRASAEVGISARDIPDPNFDKVKAYHAAAWEKAYGLEIPTSHDGEV